MTTQTTISTTDTKAIPSRTDPTDLTCEACGENYPLNSPRVRKALTTKRAADCEAAKLCWVCARLKYSADVEAAETEKAWRCEG